MKLSEYCSNNENYWANIEYATAQKFIKFLCQKTGVDLYQKANSTNELEIFKKLNIWLFNFYHEEFLEALMYIGYDYHKYERSIIYSFILSVTRNRPNINLLYEVLISKKVIEKMLKYDNSEYVIITKDFGEIHFTKADKRFIDDTELQKYRQSLGNNILDACHEISFLIIKNHKELRAVTAICEKALNSKYYHSFVIDENNDIIDLTANLIMTKTQYYLLQNVIELNATSYEKYLKEDDSKKFDESKTLFDLLRNALYKQIKIENNNHN